MDVPFYDSIEEYKRSIIVMDAEARDELLIRMDERQRQIFDMTLLQEKHLSELNTKVVRNIIDISQHESRILNVEQCLEKGIPLKLTRKQVTTIIGGLGTIGTSLFIAVGKLAGWW